MAGWGEVFALAVARPGADNPARVLRCWLAESARAGEYAQFHDRPLEA